tara:strand:- start:124 stop:246 length:123 start_codon:yes stop_codon:yes gene_type:complete
MEEKKQPKWKYAKPSDGVGIYMSSTPLPILARDYKDLAQS